MPHIVLSVLKLTVTDWSSVLALHTLVLLSIPLTSNVLELCYISAMFLSWANETSFIPILIVKGGLGPWKL